MVFEKLSCCQMSLRCIVLYPSLRGEVNFGNIFYYF